MKTFKDFWSIMNIKTLIVTVLAVASTYLCRRFNLMAEIPTGLIGLAVVFPIVFSINAAYKRREEALRYFAGFKAHAIALYFAHRDWIPGETTKESTHLKQVRELIQSLITSVKDDLSIKGRQRSSLGKVFSDFSQFSRSIEGCRKAEMTGSEVSRSNQYISKMMTDFERMRNIAAYRTPITLRAYSRVFLNFFPIAFGPYFAMLCFKSESFPLVGYMVAILYSLVLVTLDNLQEDLEDPFDELGSDDIQLDVADDYSTFIAE